MDNNNSKTVDDEGTHLDMDIPFWIVFEPDVCFDIGNLKNGVYTCQIGSRNSHEFEKEFQK